MQNFRRTIFGKFPKKNFVIKIISPVAICDRVTAHVCIAGCRCSAITCVALAAAVRWCRHRRDGVGVPAQLCTLPYEPQPCQQYVYVAFLCHSPAVASEKVSLAPSLPTPFAATGTPCTSSRHDRIQ